LASSVQGLPCNKDLHPLSHPLRFLVTSVLVHHTTQASVEWEVLRQHLSDHLPKHLLNRTPLLHRCCLQVPANERPSETQVLSLGPLRQSHAQSKPQDLAPVPPTVVLRVQKAYLVLRRCHQMTTKSSHPRLDASIRHRLAKAGAILALALRSGRTGRRGELLLGLVSLLLGFPWGILCGGIRVLVLIGSTLLTIFSLVLSLLGLHHLILTLEYWLAGSLLHFDTLLLSYFILQYLCSGSSTLLTESNTS